MLRKQRNLFSVRNSHNSETGTRFLRDDLRADFLTLFHSTRNNTGDVRRSWRQRLEG